MTSELLSSLPGSTPTWDLQLLLLQGWERAQAVHRGSLDPKPSWSPLPPRVHHL